MKVLLIRQEVDSLRTASLLEQIGLTPVLFPLFEKTDLGFHTVDANPDFLVFTSANGVGGHSSAYPESNKNRLVYAVGPRTADALLKNGYKNIRQGEGNAADLARLVIADQSGQGMKGTYFCGKHQAFDMKAALAVADIPIELCEIYQIKRLCPVKQRFLEALDSVKGGMVSLYSPQSAVHFMSLINEYEAGAMLDTICMLVISKKTAVAADNNLVKAMHISDVPNEQGMIEMAKAISTV